VTIAVQVETRIARPVADVFAALIDVESYPSWLGASGITGVQLLDAGPLHAGSRLRIAQTVAGRSTVLDGIVTVLAPGAAFGLRGKDPEGISIDIDTVVAPDEMATRLRWSLRVGLPLRYRLFESMVAPQARHAAAVDLEAFRLRLERPIAG
jgi:hypothetical protein